MSLMRFKINEMKHILKKRTIDNDLSKLYIETRVIEGFELVIITQLWLSKTLLNDFAIKKFKDYILYIRVFPIKIDTMAEILDLIKQLPSNK